MDSSDLAVRRQHELCGQYGVEWVEASGHLKVGIALNVRTSLRPLNGLRHRPEGDTTGWYIWAGQTLSEDPDFFEPLHVAHLAEWCPLVVEYLGLPPGWRFLVDSNYRDVWYDKTLLSV